MSNIEHLNHSCSHLLAAAVTELWPHALLTLGPAIENGFYYDFDFGDTKISETDFPAIETKMHELVKTWSGFEKIEISPEEAKEKFSNNPYKQEIIEEKVQGFKQNRAQPDAGNDQAVEHDLVKPEQLTIYISGKFFDLCRGGHTIHPKSDLKHFKLLSVAGAYWRGSEKNKMLTRIYGTCWPTQKDLDNYLTLLEETKKRDHRKLGKILDLFTFSDLIGSGFPLFPFGYPKVPLSKMSWKNGVKKPKQNGVISVSVLRF
jgi:threonyl-tRNA synthetase